MAAAYTEYSGSLSAGAFSIPANPGRRGLIVANNSDTAMTVRIGAAATATVGVPLPPGQTVQLKDPDCPSALVSIFCAGASKAYTAYEW